MKKVQLNAGDLITVETIGKSYKDKGDINLVIVDGPGSSAHRS